MTYKYVYTANEIHYHNAETGKYLHTTPISLSGAFRTRDEEGNVKQLFQYKNGLLEGKFTQFQKNGLSEFETHYKNGREDGVRKEFDEEGKLVSRLFYVEDRLSEVTSFHPNGQEKCFSPFYDDLLHGTQEYYNDKGKLIANIHWENGEKKQKELYNHKNGNTKITQYEAGKQKGPEREYNSQGRHIKDHVVHKLGDQDYHIVMHYNELGKLEKEEAHDFLKEYDYDNETITHTPKVNGKLHGKITVTDLNDKNMQVHPTAFYIQNNYFDLDNKNSVNHEIIGQNIMQVYETNKAKIEDLKWKFIHLRPLNPSPN